MTVQQAADYLRVPKYTIYTLLQQGALPYVKIGKRHLVMQSDLLKYLEKNKRQEGSPQKQAA